MKHTPGPWEKIQSVKDRNLFIIQCNHTVKGWGSYRISQIKSGLAQDFEISNANANLIAAAPDLLEACKAVLTVFHYDSMIEEDFAPEIKMLEAAIVKAEGR